MIEVITTNTDGQQFCYELPEGGVYEIRGDEVSIEVRTVKRVKRAKK